LTNAVTSDVISAIACDISKAAVGIFAALTSATADDFLEPPVIFLRPLSSKAVEDDFTEPPLIFQQRPFRSFSGNL